MTARTSSGQFPAPTFVEHLDDAGRNIRLAVYERGPDDGVPVVFCHGFPELAYSWRHQLRAVGDAGFRAIAPDMRGYGASSCPSEIDAYRIDRLCGDLVAVLDDRGIDKAVFVGHDWGGFVAWAMPLLHPERCLGLVGVCTPYMGMPATSVLRMMIPDDERLYILWFQEDGLAESVMDPHTAAIFERLMRGGVDPASIADRLVADDGLPDMNPFRSIALESGAGGADDGMGAAMFGEPMVDAEELARYVETFAKTGFRGGINWYRNIDANIDLIPGVGTTPLDLPCLMLTAKWDPALRPEMADGMPAVISDLERHDIDGAGHWVQQEKPDHVNRHLVDWLQRRFTTP